MSLSRRQMLSGAATVAITTTLPLQAMAYVDKFPAVPWPSFEAEILAHVASSMGVSYEALSHDWSVVNYSSARVSLLDAWKDGDRE